jgi:hypothetical protein
MKVQTPKHSLRRIEAFSSNGDDAEARAISSLKLLIKKSGPCGKIKKD